MPRLDEASILGLLQDGAASDWAGLVRATAGFDLPPGNLAASDAQAFFLRKHLDALRDAGLVTYRRQTSDNWPAIAGPITLNPTWHDVADGLGVHSAAKLHESADPRSLLVRPFFGQPCEPAEPADLLVLMPSREDRTPLYDDHIKAVAHQLGLTAKRVDDVFTTHSVMPDNWPQIYASRALIAECTGRPPNVFYELGIAHTLGKPVVLITQNSDDVPFDLRHARYIKYESTPPGMSLFEQRLAATLRMVLGLAQS